ncbi:hypothetical protein B0H10DRAFT_2428127 [Mycena sp. CBHHK59/15]|nr:hypothetical protein B0H10DRAFT_2428127 [Mycena sp. CBHHK59/15]
MEMPKVVTRTKNKNAHPAFDTGHRKPWQTRHTTTQMKADQAREDQARIREEEERKKHLSDLAALEDKMRQDDMHYAEHANHPANAIARPPVVLKNSEHPEFRHDGEEEAEEEPESEGHDELVADPESEEESDEEDPDEDVQEKRRGRPRAPKTTRSDVVAARKTKAISGTPDVDVTTRKRKASPKTKGTGKKKKTTKKCGLAPKRTASSASGRSSLIAPETDDDDKMVRLGGPALDDDPNERIELTKRTSNKKRGKPNESDFIKVSAIPPKPQTLKELRDGRNKWTLADLPLGASKLFTEELTPVARELVGSLHDPWAPLTEVQIQNLVDLIYGEGVYDVSDSEAWKGLLTYRLTDWRSGIGAQALKGVQAMIDVNQDDNYEEPVMDRLEDPIQSEGTASELGSSPNLRTPEGIAAFVEWALQPQDHTYPYHWRKWGNGTKKEGLFEAHLITYTFSYHLTALDAIPEHLVPPDDPIPPIGALILSIQATERALRAWSTGKLYIAPRTAGQFSGDNWGDNTKLRNGKTVKNKRATKYVKSIQAFTRQQWESIYDDALPYVEKKRKSNSSRGTSSEAEMPIESDEDDDFVLVADS